MQWDGLRAVLRGFVAHRLKNTAFLRIAYCCPSCQKMQPDNSEKRKIPLRKLSPPNFVQRLKNYSQATAAMFSARYASSLGFFACAQGKSGGRVGSEPLNGAVFPSVAENFQEILRSAKKSRKSLFANTLIHIAPSDLAPFVETVFLGLLDFT